VLIPCLRDEGYARMKGVRRAFESARAVAFHVAAERDLATSLYDFSRADPLVLGKGVDTGWSADAGRFRRTYGLEGPLLLYAGRREAGKNTPLLLQYFLRYLAERGGAGLGWRSSAPCPPPSPGGRKASSILVSSIARTNTTLMPPPMSLCSLR
jgi:hypothetical protein